MAIESGVRRIVVGVDGSAESVAALRWACREASLRAAEVLAVLALGAVGGTVLRLSAEGEDAPDALAALTSCVSGLVD